jgi:hypothetical protein
MMKQELCILLSTIYLKKVRKMASPRERGLGRVHIFEVCSAASKCAARASLLQAERQKVGQELE